MVTDATNVVADVPLLFCAIVVGISPIVVGIVVCIAPIACCAVYCCDSIDMGSSCVLVATSV